MKKLGTLVLLVLLFSLNSCTAPEKCEITTGLIEIKKTGDIVDNTTLFRNLRADISSRTESVGLTSSESSTATRSDNGNHYGWYKKNGFIKHDEGAETSEEIEFIVNLEDDNNKNKNGEAKNKGDIIKQEELTGSIDKIYVLDGFSLISYVSLDIENLLNSTDTIIEEYNGYKHYSGKIEVDYATISFTYDDNSDFIDLTYLVKDENGEIISEGTNEKLSIRTDQNTFFVENEKQNVTFFDTCGYITNGLRQSYIVDNSTGLLYKLGSEFDLSVHNGILFNEEEGPLDIRIGNNDELVFTQIIANNDLYIFDIFKDKYNHFFVLNDLVNEVVSEDGFDVVYFTKNSEYVPCSSGIVLHIDFANDSLNYPTEYYQVSSSDVKDLLHTDPITKVSFVGENLEDQVILDTDYIEVGYSPIKKESNVSEILRKYNNVHSKDYPGNPENGSVYEYDRVENGKLYGSYSNGVFRAIFSETSIENGLTTLNDYICENDKYYFVIPDGNTLIVASNVLNSYDSQYSLYAVYPYERDEFRQHYFKFIMDSQGNVTVSKTYDEFKKELYSAFRKMNSYKYTPSEFREKYQIDLEGIGNFVEGYTKIEGAKYYEEGIDPMTLETVAYYYVWKEGYSDKVFDDMYFRGVYKEDGVVKNGLDKHVILEKVSFDKVHWTEDSNLYDMQFKVSTASSTKSYYIVFDAVDEEYVAALSSEVEKERRKTVLQPINK